MNQLISSFLFLTLATTLSITSAQEEQNVTVVVAAYEKCQRSLSGCRSAHRNCTFHKNEQYTDLRSAKSSLSSTIWQKGRVSRKLDSCNKERKRHAKNHNDCQGKYATLNWRHRIAIVQEQSLTAAVMKYRKVADDCERARVSISNKGNGLNHQMRGCKRDLDQCRRSRNGGKPVPVARKTVVKACSKQDKEIKTLKDENQKLKTRVEELEKLQADILAANSSSSTGGGNIGGRPRLREKLLEQSLKKVKKQLEASEQNVKKEKAKVSQCQKEKNIHKKRAETLERSSLMPMINKIFSFTG